MTDEASATIKKYEQRRIHETIRRVTRPDDSRVSAVALFEETDPVFDTPTYVIVQPDGTDVWVQTRGENCNACDDNENGLCPHATLAVRGGTAST